MRYVYKTHNGHYETTGGQPSPLIERARTFAKTEVDARAGLETFGPSTEPVPFADELRAAIIAMRNRSIALAQILEQEEN